MKLAKIVKRLAVRAGLDPAAFSGHSLRSGLATSAAEGGATERAIMEQTRHRSLKQVRKYIRRGSLFKDNAAARSGSQALVPVAFETRRHEIKER